MTSESSCLVEIVDYNSLRKGRLVFALAMYTVLVSPA